MEDSNSKQTVTTLLYKEDNVMKKQFKNLTIKRGILYRKLHANDEEIEQLVLPECYRGLVLRGLHNDVGHPGRWN